MAYNATILAIGSELLSGQILNRNAQWISQKLIPLGFDVCQHLTVDDDETAIIQALNTLAKVSDYIFVTGGLGPTTDDITRNAVAEWSGKELVYDPSSWRQIEEIFAKFQRRAPATNKQQCFFPEGADILRNREGTANGFHLSLDKKQIWILPGPPKEVAAIWTDHVDTKLQLIVPESDKKTTKMWRTIGVGESHLAEILNPIVLGKPVSVAYRAHAPYVETKITFPNFSSSMHQELLATVEQAIKKWLFETDDEDTVAALVQELNRFSSIDIYDGVTHGHIAQFLAPHIKSTPKMPKQASIVTSWEEHDSPRQFVEQCFAVSGSSELALAVAGFDQSGQWAFGVRNQKITEVVERPSVYSGEDLRSRNQIAIAGLAIKGWLELLGRQVN